MERKNDRVDSEVVTAGAFPIPTNPLSIYHGQLPLASSEAQHGHAGGHDEQHKKKSVLSEF